VFSPGQYRAPRVDLLGLTLGEFRVRERSMLLVKKISRINFFLNVPKEKRTFPTF
jgi:hypothetical protein